MDFTQFFDKMESQESYTILFITIVGFLFGLLVGLLLRTAKVRRLRKELNETKTKYDEAQVQLTAAREELQKNENALQEAQQEARTLVDKMQVLEQEKDNIYSQVYSLNTELEQEQASNRTYAATIEELSDQIVGLKTQNEQLAAEIEALRSAPVATPNDTTAADTLSRMEVFEAKLDKLAAENEMLKSRINEVQASGGSLPLEVGAIHTSTSDTPEPELGIAAEKTVLKRKIITDGVNKDDLTQIGGVGPFMQQQLYDAGIYSYEQISQFEKAQIDHITREIGYFPGRIEKDDWVGQAKALMANPPKPKGKSKKSSRKPKVEDLKIIEGIGPKIEGILKAAGISNWTDLAASSQKRLREILNAAGKRYKMHDPETWSQQATLAANDKWDELKELQDKLKGGRS
jgi:predicted flap endonuclease-1-like 5' DNA nuclease